MKAFRIDNIIITASGNTIRLYVEQPNGNLTLRTTWTSNTSTNKKMHTELWTKNRIFKYINKYVK